MKKQKNEEGITLVELMVAIAVVGIIIAALYLAYFTAVRVFGFNQERVEFHRDQRLISESIGKYIRSAKEIEISSDVLQIIYGPTSNKKVKFYKNNDNYFYIDTDPDDSTVGERKISQLTINNDDIFSDKDDKLVIINITLSNNNGEIYDFEEKFNPRIENVLMTP